MTNLGWEEALFMRFPQLYDLKNHIANEFQQPATVNRQYKKQNIGLSNQYNTCFINSSLQCLFNIKELAIYYLEANQGEMSPLHQEIANIIKAMWKKDHDVGSKYTFSYNMRTFNDKIGQTFEYYKINKYKQMDSPQFIQIFLSYIMSNPLTNANKRQGEKLKEIFQGSFRTIIKCKEKKYYYTSQIECNSISVDIKEKFLSIPLTIDQNKVQQPAFFDRANYYFSKICKSSRSIKLSDCLSNFSKKDLLENENKWQCKSCLKDTTSERLMRIFSTGKVVIIHLLRFSGERKIRQTVEYPEIIQQDELLQRESKQRQSIYRLNGVICHLGYSMKGGHYNCFCFNECEQKWYKYNDSHVYEAYKTQYLNNSDAYVLLYKKQEAN